MRSRVLLDTGPLVAFLNAADRYHPWAVAQLESIRSPLFTCEAVISQACFVLKHTPGAAPHVLELLRRGLIEMPFQLAHEARAVQLLLNKYANLPASVADACLVRMSEIYGQSPILTLDRHFRVYRKHTRRVIPVIMPEGTSG